VPGNYDKEIVDAIEIVTYEDAIATSRRLCREEGIFVGISSGAVACGALRVAERLGAGKRVVAILADLGERYLSHELFTGAASPGNLIDATQEP
jgi:cysteine synthase